MKTTIGSAYMLAVLADPNNDSHAARSEMQSQEIQTKKKKKSALAHTRLLIYLVAARATQRQRQKWTPKSFEACLEARDSLHTGNTAIYMKRV